MTGSSKFALVLAGGGARGAYQVGVVRYLREALPEPARSRVHFDIIAGSSVGAINGAFLATSAHEPHDQGTRLQECWSHLHAQEILDVGWGRLLRLGGELAGRRDGVVAPAATGILNVDPIVRTVHECFAWPALERNLADGALEAICISATEIASGRTFIFVQTRDGALPAWAKDPRRFGVATRIRPAHALASAALPLIFPPVEVDGRWFCDGGLRQLAPLSPALRLGADRALVVSLRHVPLPQAPELEQTSALAEFPSAAFLLSKVLHSLLLDPLDHDLHTLEVINSILELGERRCGPEFREHLAETVARARGVAFRPVRALVLRPSVDPGVLAERHAQGLKLRAPLRHLLRLGLRLTGPKERQGEGDLLSYFLFDAPYLQELVQLGYADAAAHEQELMSFFSEPGEHPSSPTRPRTGEGREGTRAA